VPPPSSKPIQLGPTFEEPKYLRTLIDKQTPISISLISGETFQGKLEYYDKTFLRLTREGEPNLFIYKREIKYLFENPE
jgi:host factor-I protein